MNWLFCSIKLYNCLRMDRYGVRWVDNVLVCLYKLCVRVCDYDMDFVVGSLICSKNNLVQSGVGILY